jgi:hypothetical protein
MKISDYERGAHNCLEHVYRSHDNPETWRCSECLRRTPRPVGIQQAFDTHFNDINEWFKVERCKYKIHISDYAYRAIWSSVCPQCHRYIRRDSSWIVELVYPHENTLLSHHSSGEYHEVTGRYVHWDCYKEILRQRPCWYCGETPAGTIDHRVPRSRGGADEPNNLVAACASCNSSKGARNETVHILHKEMPDMPEDDWLAA